MSFHFSDGPIVAISTGTSEKSALGIVRVSGVKNLKFLVSLTGQSKFSEPESHKVYFSRFYTKNRELLDEGVFTYFKGPKSFTGENTVEFTLHGNPFNLERVLRYLVDEFGFRMAQPGEFSYRALKNNKMNLTQVEGLDLILNASSEFGLNSGLKALNNDLYSNYLRLRELILEIKASVEILIDFSEDVGEEEIKSKLNRDFSQLRVEVDKLYQRSKGNLNDLMAPVISLIGATNAGKSTLFNKLVGHNRAIVSDIHGTTRDYISEFIYLGDSPFKLIDTAGIREGAGEIEKIGIDQSIEINRKSFFKILVINPFSFIGSDLEIHGLKPDAIVLTHSDLDGFKDRVGAISVQFKDIPLFQSGSIGADSKSGPMGADSKSGPMGAESKSGPMGAESKSGPMGADSKSGPMGADSKSGPMGADSESGPIGALNDLENMILKEYQVLKEGSPIPFVRHRNVISAIYDELNNIYSVGQDLDDCAILSHHVNILSSKMDELIGVVSPQEVLDHIFANFCIGK